MKRIFLAAALLGTPLFAEDVADRIDRLERQLEALESENSETQSILIEEMGSLKEAVYAPEGQYESFSSLGQAASKVYHSKNDLSIGGYGEYRFRKYFDFQNYDESDAPRANETRNTLESNVVRFIPYIGYRFNDWIVMNTELEFEDGGARSDNTGNYKYAIVEFSYLDFLLDEKYALRVGHLLVPMGLTNLNHEPTAFLSADRPTVEMLLIPSTWHTNGALVFGTLGDYEYYAGAVTMPDAGGFIPGRFIQQGKLGARQFTEDLGFVARVQHDRGALSLGGSMLFGTSTVSAESRPGVDTGHDNPGAEVPVRLMELHASLNMAGWDVQALAAYGTLSGDAKALGAPTAVNGQYITAGYNLMDPQSSQRLLLTGEIERLDLDANGESEFPGNHRFIEYGAGFAYYPDPRVVVKADYVLRDYDTSAKLADEKLATATLGFIF
jgi:hypothetical protein